MRIPPQEEYEPLPDYYPTHLRKELKISEHETGTVKWLNEAKGFGLIQQDAGGDVFVHYSTIAGGGLRSLITVSQKFLEEKMQPTSGVISLV